MDRTKYTEEYRATAKKYGGNIVSSVNSALKGLDAERQPAKIAALTETAKKALEQAVKDLKPMTLDTKLANKARQFIADLEELSKKIQSRKKDALEDVKEAAADAKEETSDKKATTFTKEIEPLHTALMKEIQRCSARQKNVWTAIEKFSEKRWKCIYAFAKGHDASANGFRGFPFAIPMMVAELSGKEMSDKGVKGSVQTLGMNDHDEAAGGDKVKTQFVSYSKKEVQSEMDAVVKELDELDKAFLAAGKHADDALKLAEKIAKSTKDGKVTSECAKLKGAVTVLNNNLDKATKNVMLLTKKVKKEGGLGEEDAEFRDAFQDIPTLNPEAVHKSLLALKAHL